MRIRQLTIAIAALVLVGAACAGSTSSATGQPPPPTIGIGSDTGSARVSGGADVRSVDGGKIDTVVMIGDSITVASRPALESAFADLGFTNIVIEAVSGKRAVVDLRDNPSGKSVAEFMLNAAADDESADRSNELWVIALGTNDINQYDGPDELAAALDELTELVPDESPLIWVDTYFRDHPDGTGEVNAAIEQQVRARGAATIAAWSEVAAGDGNLRVDGVHPRDAGAEVFATTIHNTIVDFLQLG